MHRHANRAAAFASPPLTRPRPGDPALSTDARTLMRTVLTTNRPAYGRLVHGPQRHIVYRLTREDGRSCPVEALARLFTTAHAAGITVADLRRIPLFLDAHLDRLAALTPRALAELDLEESKHERAETRLAEERHLQGETPERLAQEIDALEREQAVTREKLTGLRARRLALLHDGRPLVTLRPH